MNDPHASAPLRLRLAARSTTAALLGIVLACSEDSTEALPEAPPPVVSVEVTPSVDTLNALGRSKQFTAVARDSQAAAVTGKIFAWASTNTSVATVNPTGVAASLGNGVTSITATVDGITGTATLYVVQEIDSVDVTPFSATIERLGVGRQFEAVALDSNRRRLEIQPEFTWSSSNEDVATVDSAGTATAVGNGTAVIIAVGGGLTGKATLSVASPTIEPYQLPDTLLGYTDWLVLPSPWVIARDGSGTPIGGRQVTFVALDGNFGQSGFTTRTIVTDGEGRAGLVWLGGPEGINSLTSYFLEGNDTIRMSAPILARVGPKNDWVTEFGDQVWSNPSNWSQGRVPDAGDHVKLVAAGSHTITVDVSATIAGMTNHDLYSSTTMEGARHVLIPADIALMLTDTVLENYLTIPIVLDGGTLVSARRLRVGVDWRSGRLAYRDGAISIRGSTAENKVLDLTGYVFVQNDLLTWAGSAALLIRGGATIDFSNGGVFVSGDSNQSFGSLLIGSEDGLTPTLRFGRENLPVQFEFSSTTPSSIVLDHVLMDVVSPISVQLSGPLPQVGDYYDLILVQNNGVFQSSYGFPSNANYEFQVNPEPGVALRAIRRQ